MSYTNGLDKPSDYFETVLYAGNSGTQSITSLDFQPDWCWFKARNNTDTHAVFDSVRGVQERLIPNNDSAEGTQSNGLTHFLSNGFTVGDAGIVNQGYNYVSWNWLGANGTAANTDGSISSTVSANTTSGFSIVSYTGNGTSGATIGHGLSSAPSMIIVKGRTNVNDFRVQHGSLGATKALDLNGTGLANTQIGNWNNTEPTSSVFSLGNFAATNQNTITYIAYCFAEKKGYSKFGSYTGNGNADGPMIVTGMKPAWVMVKKTSGTGNWMIIDNKRSASGGFNVLGERLKANASDAGSTADYQDHLSNGFKIRTTASSWNDSGGTYIYMAFAENPFVTSTGVPATAR